MPESARELVTSLKAMNLSNCVLQPRLLLLPLWYRSALAVYVPDASHVLRLHVYPFFCTSQVVVNVHCSTYSLLSTNICCFKFLRNDDGLWYCHQMVVKSYSERYDFDIDLLMLGLAGIYRL